MIRWCKRGRRVGGSWGGSDWARPAFGARLGYVEPETEIVKLEADGTWLTWTELVVLPDRLWYFLCERLVPLQLETAVRYAIS